MRRWVYLLELSDRALRAEHFTPNHVSHLLLLELSQRADSWHVRSFLELRCIWLLCRDLEAEIGITLTAALRC